MVRLGLAAAPAANGVRNDSSFDRLPAFGGSRSHLKICHCMAEYQPMIDRHVKPLIQESLAHFPVVTILGARQVGKSTLAQMISSGTWQARYRTLDELALLDAALADPDGFVGGLELPVVLDEIQRSPELLRSIKRVVDRDRTPGRFLLTGSANLLTMQNVSETLAGRAALLDLHPFSWAELHRSRAPSPFLDNLFEHRNARKFASCLPKTSSVERNELRSRILSGGYPTPSLMPAGRPRSQWFESYRRTYLERDLRQVANVLRLPEFGRLLTAVALRTGQLLNATAFSRDLGVPLNTIRRHLGILETTYQVWTVPPFHVNLEKRLVKTPKLYFADTGLACHLSGFDDWEHIERQGRAGPTVETWVASELRKIADLGAKRTEIYFWRTHAGREVDFLLARGDQLVAIEVKCAQRVTSQDIANIMACAHDLNGRLGLAVILYSGEATVVLNERIAAVPITTFFAGQRR